MGGWHYVNPYYTNEKILGKCKCGKGNIISSLEVKEESDYPPFERGEQVTYSTCPDKCE